MPSLTTHYIFADMVYKKLDKSIQKTIDNDIYLTFSQSHDFLYYSFDKKIKRLGSEGHHKYTQNYLINIVKNIIDNKLENNKECLAFLYGSITHYCLDTICHPYIFYKTGTYYKNKPDHIKYRGQHTHIEKQLDAFYYKKYFNKEYHKANISKEIIKTDKLSNELKQLITDAYYDTYKVDNVGDNYDKIIRESKLIVSLVTNDRFGFKYHFFKFLNLIIHSHPEYYSSYIKEPINHYLNNERKEWNDPCDINIKYHYSFDDLMDIAKKECLEIIEQCNECIFKTKDIEKLKEYIPDKDYANGYPTDNDKVMKYFEY